MKALDKRGVNPITYDNVRADLRCDIPWDAIIDIVGDNGRHLWINPAMVQRFEDEFTLVDIGVVEFAERVAKENSTTVGLYAWDIGCKYGLYTN